jgi:hypothetical protein
MPELIVEWDNGRLGTSTRAAIEAVDAVRKLSPAKVRASVSERFCSSRMVNDYLALYRRILSERASKGSS